MDHEIYDIDNHGDSSKDTQYKTDKSADESHGVSQDPPAVSSLSKPSEDEQFEANPIDEEAAEPTENNLPLEPGIHSNEELVQLSCDVIANTSPQNSPMCGDPNGDMQDNTAATLLREEMADDQELTDENSPLLTEIFEEEKIQESIIIRVDDDAGVMLTSCTTPLSPKTNVLTFEKLPDFSSTQPNVDENALVAMNTDANLRKPNNRVDSQVVEITLEIEKNCLEKVKNILEEVHASEMDRRKSEPNLPQDSSESPSVSDENVMKDQPEEESEAELDPINDPVELLFQVSPPLTANHGSGGIRMKYKKLTENVVMTSWGKPLNMSKPRTPALGYLPALLRRPLSAQSCKNYGELRLASLREETLIPRESAEQALPQQGCPLVVCTAVSSRLLQNDPQESQLHEDVKDPSAAVAQCDSEENNEPNNTESPTSTVKLPEDPLVKEECSSHTPILAPVNAAKQDLTLPPPPPVDTAVKVQQDNKKEKHDSTLPPLRTHKSLPIIKKVDAPGKTDAEFDLHVGPLTNGRFSRADFEALDVKTERDSHEVVPFHGSASDETPIVQRYIEAAYNHATKGLLRERRSLTMVEEILMDLRSAGIGVKRDTQEEENTTPPPTDL